MVACEPGRVLSSILGLVNGGDNMRILGLDVGPTSIGTALIDGQRIRVALTRIFPEGVDKISRVGSSPKAKCVASRVASGDRSADGLAGNG